MLRGQGASFSGRVTTKCTQPHTQRQSHRMLKCKLPQLHRSQDDLVRQVRNVEKSRTQS